MLEGATHGGDPDYPVVKIDGIKTWVHHLHLKPALTEDWMTQTSDRRPSHTPRTC